ncbi:hypothetical protein [Streptosporangium sp. NPDC000396]|uniref:hypothetical protein n=1 Tax=Streptosporangium sp. NPDC000396 TaxID=3366185 RepID=UPI0036BCFDE6
MRIIRSVVAALALGAGFGAVTSFVNDVSSPYGEAGGRLVNAGWAWVTEVAGVASLLLDAGWAWAALAVAAGWLAGALARGAVAGAVALAAATAAYYCMDSLLREEPLVSYREETLYWWLASLVLGPVLGVVGARAGRPGTIGLLAKLTVPVGAIVQMIFLPPGFGLTVRPAAVWALVIVWGAAAAGIGVVVTRFAAERRVRPVPAPLPQSALESHGSSRLPGRAG